MTTRALTRRRSSRRSGVRESCWLSHRSNSLPTRFGDEQGGYEDEDRPQDSEAILHDILGDQICQRHAASLRDVTVRVGPSTGPCLAA